MLAYSVNAYCQSSPVSVQQFCHHSPPDSSVCGCRLCGEERFVFNSISYRKKEEEEGGGGVGTLSTYLSIYPSLEGGLTY